MDGLLFKQGLGGTGMLLLTYEPPYGRSLMEHLSIDQHALSKTAHS